MGSFSRRGLLIGFGSGVAGSLLSAPASATVVRSVSLAALARGSRGIAVVTPLTSESHYEDLGRRRRIVTDTRVRIEESLAKAEGLGTEVLVRTLGGAVGREGERVHGQVQWALSKACVAFLLQGPDGVFYVNGMSQGHYPIVERAERLLTASPDLPEIMNFDASAVKVLSGTALGRARSLIRAAVQP
ncbi:MAG: hypothetical protein EOO73_02015 [Myxococcales bacterium]|nr:MAG: hypothetical protein EOO73_02015 [Myxococcales bacterium]